LELNRGGAQGVRGRRQRNDQKESTAAQSTETRWYKIRRHSTSNGFNIIEKKKNEIKLIFKEKRDEHASSIFKETESITAFVTCLKFVCCEIFVWLLSTRFYFILKIFQK
jgi:hypothetical protein